MGSKVKVVLIGFRFAAILTDVLVIYAVLAVDPAAEIMLAGNCRVQLCADTAGGELCIFCHGAEIIGGGNFLGGRLAAPAEQPAENAVRRFDFLRGLFGGVERAVPVLFYHSSRKKSIGRTDQKENGEAMPLRFAFCVNSNQCFLERRNAAPRMTAIAPKFITGAPVSGLVSFLSVS